MARSGASPDHPTTRVAAAALVLAAVLAPSDAPAQRLPCPPEMAWIEGRFCIDRWEASLERVGEDGRADGPFPHNKEIGKAAVRAVSRAGVLPQAHVTRDEAAAACGRAGKRLCADEEWLSVCRGPTPTRWPYGPRRRSGYCNDEGTSPLNLLYGRSYTNDYRTMNDPRLNEVAGGLARTGHFARCTSGHGVFDMVGNLHEWTAAPRGTFRGGYYLDTTILGEGCEYSTSGHAATYRDYSIGFRCCADVAP